VVDSQVQAGPPHHPVCAAHLPARQAPSQQAAAQAFAPIEALAHAALQRAGLQRDDAQPRLIAEVGVRSGQALPDWPHYPPAWWGWGPGRGWRPGMRAGATLREMPPTCTGAK
jgi:hypothetical protein